MSYIVLIYFMLPPNMLEIVKIFEKMHFQPEGVDKSGKAYNKCKDLEVA